MRCHLLPAEPVSPVQPSSLHLNCLPPMTAVPLFPLTLLPSHVSLARILINMSRNPSPFQPLHVARLHESRAVLISNAQCRGSRRHSNHLSHPGVQRANSLAHLARLPLLLLVTPSLRPRPSPHCFRIRLSISNDAHRVRQWTQLLSVSQLSH